MIRFAALTLMIVGGASMAFAAGAPPMIKDIKTVSSAAARRMVDICSAWAEGKNLALAMVVYDASGNMLEFHAMEGATESAIATAPLKAKTALRWRRTTTEVNRTVSSGENLAPLWIGDFPMPGGVPIMAGGQVAGAMGVSSADGDACAKAAIESVIGRAAIP